MPLTPIVEVDTYTASATVPQPGDPDATASLIASAQVFANRTHNLEQHSYMGDQNGTTPWMPVALDYPVNKDIFGTDWNYDYIVGAWNQHQNAAPNAIAWAVKVPMRGKILAVDIRFGGKLIGGTAHAGQPGTMPALALFGKKDGVSTTLAVQADTWVNIATYDAVHWLGGTNGVVLGTPHPIDFTEQILLAFAGEDGANALADDLGVCSARIKLAPP